MSVISKMEKTINSISREEFQRNSKARVMALEIQKKIRALKNHLNEKPEDLSNQGVLKYLNPKLLLEN